MYRLGDILGSVGHRVQIHKITTDTGKERGDLEIKEYVVWQKPQEQPDCLPPPRTLILDFTLTHTRLEDHMCILPDSWHTRRSDGVPEPDGTLRTVTRKKILHYHQLYINRPDPIVFMSVPGDTSDHIDDFSRLLFLHVHREPSVLTNELRRNRVNFVFFVDGWLRWSGISLTKHRSHPHGPWTSSLEKGRESRR